jgi:hypothetical protein
MGRVLAWTRHEIRELAPIVGYFFVAFNVIGFTKVLLLRNYGISQTTSEFAAATIGALVMGKVALLVGLLPFMEPFPKVPITYNALWKTLIYLLGAVGFQLLEDLIRDRSLTRFVESLTTPHFWAIQIWLFLVILGFCMFRQMSLVLGQEKTRELFLGPVRATPGKA